MGNRQSWLGSLIKKVLKPSNGEVAAPISSDDVSTDSEENTAGTRIISSASVSKASQTISNSSSPSVGYPSFRQNLEAALLDFRTISGHGEQDAYCVSVAAMFTLNQQLLYAYMNMGSAAVKLQFVDMCVHYYERNK
ncbi:uncharacterized protein LOC126679265 [Mercurialis annua]|uniref:uncharacterized protein LOC126679265 n=1 Tax=Mercurialis annua TaxID=3986 RepID=UPI00215F7794|nr:uncharacterized protein LOC126679265 [Mercurialis annua]